MNIHGAAAQPASVPSSVQQRHLPDPNFNIERKNEPSDSLLPAFSTKQYNHLPTPQSPNNFGRYVLDAPYSPESPMPHSNSSSSMQNQRPAHRRSASDVTPSRFNSPSQQYMTPESSPHMSRHNNGTVTPRYLVPSASGDFSTPKQNPPIKLEAAPHITSGTTESRMVTPSSPTSEQPNHSSALSSPFMAKMSIADNLIKNHGRTVESRQIETNNVKPTSSSNQNALPGPSISTPPISPPQEAVLANQAQAPGGEMERIRQSMLAERMAQSREAEKRRPEYLKRAKRTLSEADPNYLEDEDNLPDNDRALAIGIMESPHKGRRLKLFQETSEESFEESLMAGGYGRYRTADWVRQPQPISLPSAAIAGSSNIVSLLEEAEEQPPSAKEIKKRKRLAAFKSASTSHSKLCAVELEGKGRVLLDMQPEEQGPPASPEPTPNKKRVNSRRKKKNTELAHNKKASIDLDALDEQTEKPNWPDTEFPWRLRTEERVELAKAEEEERMRWIERFLDRDSDDEDDAEPSTQDETASLSKFGVVYDNAAETAYPMGRGKMVPLLAYSDNTRVMSRRIAFPSDPADARAALLSKRSVRSLSYRQQKRQRKLDDEEDNEVVCICHGKDDGRELVQCDACQTWYHLECIGIKSVSELGREEDPWFCRRCVRSPSPSRELDNRIASEPTFAPTDDEPFPRRVLDAPFFPPTLQASPNWTSLKTPRTPTRGGATADFSYTWSDSSRPGPSTPQQSTPDVKFYSSPLYGYGNYEESPFDPTSTPSRGIRFHAPFATPKNNTWLPRAPLFQTPSKPSGRGLPNASVGSYPPVLDDPVLSNNFPPHDRYGRTNGYDDSPIRRNKPQDNSRHFIHSPARSKIPGSNLSFLEESPVVRSLIPTERERQRTTFEGGKRYDEDPIS